MEKQATVNEYYDLLGQFVDICHASVKRGQAYISVMLCHELFRFLYPVEPFANFEQNDPIKFSIEHIRKLIATGKTMQSGFAPYAWNPDASLSELNDPLEKTTSDLYSALWTGFTKEELVEESRTLVEKRLPAEVIRDRIKGKRVLDMGCGSGRYSIALSQLGASHVDAIDVQEKAFAAARSWCKANEVEVHFHEGNVHKLPFNDNAFDFIFCNGVLHHTSSVAAGVRELSRVMRGDGAAFLYLYGAGGIFWNTRTAVRPIFKNIPLQYTRGVLQMIGMPSKRFIFCDTWYVPVETLTTATEMLTLLDEEGFSYKKLTGNNAFDLDRGDLGKLPNASEMWGDGEHRYLLWSNQGAEGQC